MAEKAIIKQIDYLKRTGKGDYEIGVTALVTDGLESFWEVRGRAFSTTLSTTLPTWKSLMKDAVIAAALEQRGLVVDDVAFPDFITPFAVVI